MKNRKWTGIGTVCAAFVLACGSLALGAEENADAAEMEQAVEASAGADAETDAAVNEYGFTDAQMEALLESVKTSVTEEYLNAYDVSSEDLQLELGTSEEAANFDFDGYNWGLFWRRIDDVLLEDELELTMYILTQAYDDGQQLAEELASKEYTWEPTLEEQNQKVVDNSAGGIVYDPAAQEYPLANAVYIGIANYLNGLDYEEAADIFFNMCKAEQAIVDSGTPDNGGGWLTFDRVLVDHFRLS